MDARAHQQQHQQQVEMGGDGGAAGQGCMPPPSTVHTHGTAAKTRTRQVAARYLQPKTAAQGGGLGAPGPLTGRASLAGYGSVGWVETQHPHHAGTPLMLQASASTGPLGGASGTARGVKTRSGAPLPTPVSSAAHRQAMQQFATPAPAPPAATPSTSGRAALHSRQYGGMQTPRNLSMSAAISRPSSTAERPGVHSADLTGSVATQLPADGGDMRAKLSAWREMKQSTRTAAKPGTFKEPAPKSTLFRATAATRANTKDPGTSRKGAGGSSGTGKAQPSAGDRGASSSGGVARSVAASTVSSPAASSVADSSTAVPASLHAGASPSSSAFSATMATLQGSGGKKTRTASQASKSGSSRPGIVPLLNLDATGSASGGGSPMLHYQQQQQQAVRSPLCGVGSSTKIPKLNLSGLAGQQHTPLSARRPSSTAGGGGGGGDGALPDATPRTVRDALPSRVPRTPRTGGTPAAGYQQQQTARRASTPEGSNDRHARQLDTSKPASVAEQQQQQQQQQHSSSQHVGGSKPVVPKLKLGAVLGGRSAGPEAAPTAAAGMPEHRAAHAHSCLSARGPSVAGRALAAAQVTPATARTRTSIDGGAAAAGTPGSAQQRGRTPRGPAAAAAGRLPTPRSLASSMSAAAAPPPAAAAAKKPDVDKADEVRQQLRLLRMQQLQLRHLNARMQTSLQAKKEKINTSVAAGAAAVVDLSNQLLKAKDQAQQATWQSQLGSVLQQQQGQLQVWAQTQAQHQANIMQLREACSSALSHVPLLSGSTVGHNPHQPDLQALQRQLQHGMQLLADLQPAMLLLMTGDVSSSSSSSSGAGIIGLRPDGTTLGSRDAHEAAHLHPKGIKDTASLSKDLMKVAEEECVLLQQLTEQLSELSDLQLYVNSMQVQLQTMRQPDLLTLVV